MRVGVRGAVAAAIGMLAFLTAAPASADEPTAEDGLWYFDWFGVQDQHDQGITGDGVTVAVIDEPVNLEVPTLADADIRVQTSPCILEDGQPLAPTSTDLELADHGTSVLSYLVGSGAGYDGQPGVKGIAPDATVLSYAVQLDDPCTGEDGPTGLPRYAPDVLAYSMMDAMDQGANIISVSLGLGTEPFLEEAVARAVREGVIVVASVANIGEDSIAADAPASLNGVVSVNQTNADEETPTIPYTDVSAPGAGLLDQGRDGDWSQLTLGSGTSFATPIVAGNLALAMQKYPQATGNQLIQSLIHNTGFEPHDLVFDPTMGYGVVLTDRFLSVDPAQYPDVNPLVTNFSDVQPTVDIIWGDEQDVEAAEAPEERPWPTYTPVASPSDTGSAPELTDEPTAAPDVGSAQSDDPAPGGAPGWMLPSIVAGLVVLAIIITVIVLVASRTKHSNGGQHGSQ